VTNTIRYVTIPTHKYITSRNNTNQISHILMAIFRVKLISQSSLNFSFQSVSKIFVLSEEAKTNCNLYKTTGY